MERGKLLRVGASPYPPAFCFVGCLEQTSRARGPVLQASEAWCREYVRRGIVEMEVDVENLEELARDLWKSDPRLVISTLSLKCI